MSSYVIIVFYYVVPDTDHIIPDRKLCYVPY